MLFEQPHGRGELSQDLRSDAGGFGDRFHGGIIAYWQVGELMIFDDYREPDIKLSGSLYILRYINVWKIKVEASYISKEDMIHWI